MAPHTDIQFGLPPGDEPGGMDLIEHSELDEEAVRRLVRRLTAIDHEMAEIKAWAETELRRLAAARNHILGATEPQLRAFLAAALGGGRRKVLKTPYGSLGFRKRPGRLETEHPEMAVDWARRACPEAVVRVVQLAPRHQEQALAWAAAECPDAIHEAVDARGALHLVDEPLDDDPYRYRTLVVRRLTGEVLEIPREAGIEVREAANVLYVASNRGATPEEGRDDA